MKIQLLPSETFVILCSNEGGSQKQECKAAQQSKHAKWVTRFYRCSREREASVFDHKGCNSSGTNEESCWVMRLKHQPKQSWGTIFMRGCPSLCCPARPGTFSRHHSITVCLHYLRSWMNRGSGLSLGSSGGPTLPCLPPPTPSLPPPLCSIQPPPTTPPQHIVHSHTNAYRVIELPPPLPSTHTHRLKPWESVSFLSASYLKDTEAFCGWITPPSGALSAVLKADLLHMGPVSSCRFVKA